MSPHLADGTRLRIIAGDPNAEEIAALVAALDEVPAPVPAGSSPPAERQTPAWLRAARREALGGAPVATPADLQRPR